MINYDDDVIRERVLASGPTGNGMDNAQIAQLRTDTTALLARPVIDQVTDIPDVVGTPADGQVIAWDAEGNQWSMIDPGVPFEVQSGGSSFRFGPVSLLDARSGLRATEAPGLPGVALLEPAYGNAANTIAEGNHEHSLPMPQRVPFGPYGYMSGGSQHLESTNVTIPTDRSILIKATVRLQVRGGDPGPCYYRVSVAIGDNVRQSVGGESGFWCVQGVPREQTWAYHYSYPPTGGTVQVAASISYFDGGGTYIDAGELEVEMEHSR